MNLNLVNYTTAAAYDGMAALELIRQEKFDLILLDVMIPQLDGFALMERIKPYNIPVIFLTAKNSVYDKVNAEARCRRLHGQAVRGDRAAGPD